MLADRDTVLQCLRMCCSGCYREEYCLYWNKQDEDSNCDDLLMMDALELLEAQKFQLDPAMVIRSTLENTIGEDDLKRGFRNGLRYALFILGRKELQ